MRVTITYIHVPRGTRYTVLGANIARDAPMATASLITSWSSVQVPCTLRNALRGCIRSRP